MRAVTIISPGFEGIGHEAARRFTEFSRLPVDVLHCESIDAHRVKLQALADAAKHDWHVLFDADWWALRPLDIPEIIGPYVAGCPIPIERAMYQGDQYGYDPRCRVTTGFITFDPSLPNWSAALKLALQLQEHGGADKDEVYFNAALHHFNIPVRVIDSGWNWCFQAKHAYGFSPVTIHAIHAAGVTAADKQAALDAAVIDHADKWNTWSLDAEEVKWLDHFASALLHSGQDRVVEFGPGLSTSTLRAAGCMVTACETDPRAHCVATTSFPGTRCELVKNEPGMSGLQAECDWSFVDGPPGRELHEGKSRWFALQWAAQRCSIIVLHDSKRDGEQASIAAMEASGWTAHYINSERGICVLTLGEKSRQLITSIL